MKKKMSGWMLVLACVVCMTAGCGAKDAQEKTAETQAVTEAAENKETQKMETEAAEGEETQKEGTKAAETQQAALEETETEAPEEIEMWAMDDVYIRADKDPEAEAVAIAKRGSQVIVTETDAEWCKVNMDGQEGYIMKKFLTDSEEEAQNAVAAQAAAEEAAARAAEEAARAAAAQSSGGAGGKTEVSRQNFDDCDGSGHGYAIITYSDGSTATVEY